MSKGNVQLKIEVQVPALITLVRAWVSAEAQIVSEFGSPTMKETIELENKVKMYVENLGLEYDRDVHLPAYVRERIDEYKEWAAEDG